MNEIRVITELIDKLIGIIDTRGLIEAVRVKGLLRDSGRIGK